MTQSSGYRPTPEREDRVGRSVHATSINDPEGTVDSLDNGRSESRAGGAASGPASISSNSTAWSRGQNVRVKHGGRCKFELCRGFEFCLHKIKHGGRNLKRKRFALFGVPSHNPTAAYVMRCSDIVKLAKNASGPGLFRKRRAISNLHETEIQNDASAIFCDLLGDSPDLMLAALYSLHDPAQTNRIWKVWPVQLRHPLVNREARPLGCRCEGPRVRRLARALRTKNNVYFCHEVAFLCVGRQNNVRHITPYASPVARN